MSVISVVGKENLEAEVNSGVSIVDFYADWCGPCKMLTPVLEELATDLAGKAKVVKVNVDQNQELAAEFKIQGVPTIVIMKDGEVVERAVGFQPKAGLVDLVNKNL
ncbi:thioredoxin [Desulfuribacillus alkaliarsenatis]|uniref:Thioredoxin n=1 Tax=Desulfuribacillus alkaliarsenatis TaxID=766136 RepID=A0A1E5G0E0_9FIRM|nr:thioredoxin [Desulfuribacillus alkaliarsenatis]OEF96250.1 thioredoxin [Desulfuribacillus alkaliarsenatis]